MLTINQIHVPPSPLSCLDVLIKISFCLEINCYGILTGWWNVESSEVLRDALARRMCPCHPCQLLESNSSQLGGFRSGDVLKNERENKAIKGKI